ncbi:MAG: YraN family protein [Hespellia sp.]|nr:YraN family protein [Hespellia sp.]
MEKKRKQNNRKVGVVYEQAVGHYLEQQGYVILEYNYRCHMGEIDIIAKDQDYLVFCEVKYRKDTGKGSPLEAVGPAKQRVISKCAQYYLLTHHLTDVACRFDVAGILGDQISVVKNAFEYIG